MQSLKDLQKWVDEVSENAKEEVVLFLIGTRADEEGKREI
jgi:GTPase SAR1 family protein